MLKHLLIVKDCLDDMVASGSSACKARDCQTGRKWQTFSVMIDIRHCASSTVGLSLTSGSCEETLSRLHSKARTVLVIARMFDIKI